MVRVIQLPRGAETAKRGHVIQYSARECSGTQIRDIDKSEVVTDASSVALGPARGKLLHAMLVYSTRHLTRLLSPSHKLIYMFPRPILPILPSDTSKPRIPAHTFFPIISPPPSCR
jgi:hypothetical protein